LQVFRDRKERRRRGFIPAGKILGEFTEDAIGEALKIGMNIKRGTDDGIKQNYGDEEGEILNRSQ
jgi:hypothetical protein